MCHVFFIHFSTDGHFVCFCVLVIVNRATVNTGVRVSFLNYGFLWVYDQELLGHTVVLFLV